MKPYHEEPSGKIYLGDCLTILKELPDESVNMVITSPPYYGLRNYGTEGQLGLEKTFAEYLKKILEITSELKRVLKPTGCFFLNLGDCYASEGKKGGDFGKDGKMTKGLSGRARTDELQSKCLMMMPERIAIAMCDQQGWILRNKICWAKQVLLKKENRTTGSVMPTSVKDRFNESYEFLYFFTKSKKYYSDLDAVRLPAQTFENRPDGIIREREFGYDTQYPEARNPMKFNYRVRDAKRKAGQPQFKASEEEIKRYNEIPEDYGKKKLQNLPDKGKTLNRWMSGTPNYTYSPADHRGKNDTTEKNYGLKKYQTGYEGGRRMRKCPNKINDPRGNHEGGPGSWRDFKDENESFTNVAGKNLPTVWLIGSEPHNFQKELEMDIDHFAIFPQALLEIPIKFGCPAEICKKCGLAREKIIETNNPSEDFMEKDERTKASVGFGSRQPVKSLHRNKGGVYSSGQFKGYTDCGCDAGWDKGIVLDPFMGSGQTAIMARKLGRNFIGIEISPKYCAIARKRLAQNLLF